MMINQVTNSVWAEKVTPDHADDDNPTNTPVEGDPLNMLLSRKA